MYHRKPDNFINGIRHALNLPIRTRCAELTVLFDRATIIELQSFFPFLINSIFGPQGTVSWGLRTITNEKCYDEDFKQLQHFLSPCGPLFRVIYTLLKDPTVKYDFPLVLIPKKIQQLLENNVQGHPFYTDLLNSPHNQPNLVSLLLNPFDYYIFHFAYHLINPWHQRNGIQIYSNWNTVYYVLCCDYMLHFFPTNPACDVLPIISYNGKNPTHFQKSNISQPLGYSHLFQDTGVIDEYSSYCSKHPRNEIWRSETVLIVFIDMWLNNDQMDLSVTQMNSSFNNSSNNIFHYNELPSSDYMRIIRVLMKQLHAFSASAKYDDTYMRELKNIAIPMVQGKFYIFLRNLIHRWPLDGSFRLVLELWLTFIQPWRYIPEHLDTFKNKLSNMENDEGTSTHQIYNIDREYITFIADNLLTYVVIFQQLLPRFSRVDLISPKICIMLYRISKVFNQPNLANILREIENSVENNHSPTHSYNLDYPQCLPPLNPTTNWCSNTTLNSSILHNESFGTPRQFTPNLNSTAVYTPQYDRKWSVIVRQKIYALEGSNFYYKPLFSSPPANEIYDIILQVKKSIQLSRELIELKQLEQSQSKASFWSLIKSSWKISVNNDEFSLIERIKVPDYLEISLKNLMELFNIIELPNIDNHLNNLSINFEISNNYKFLTSKNALERIKRMKYDGDPDLHPIRSNEIAFLVRMFYHLQQIINEKYGFKFTQLYYNPNYWGRLSRQILMPPQKVYKYEKTKRGSSRTCTDLLPRISFRNLANYNILIILFLGAIVFQMFGYGCITYFILIIGFYIIWKMIKAIPSTQVTHNYPTEGFGNISFDDSF